MGPGISVAGALRAKAGTALGAIELKSSKRVNATPHAVRDVRSAVPLGGAGFDRDV
jgi:hypothetical protein|tara:strand:+ start:253 stop:420 length:168 start_codon:yes stop_codon:yes gene_type:complete